MHLHITTLLFIVLEHINNIFTQGIPVSPCPKLFQYRFDGTEWFGILSVRNPDFGQPLNLRVTLSMRGKPTTNYLGEIELLTRGQFLSDAPVLYKIKFPKTHFPPKLLQITTNNQIICFGAADHGIFMTQIQLEHTRKLTFIPDDMAMSLTPDFSMPASTTAGVAVNGAPSTGEKDSSELLPANMGFSTKHLPLGSFDKNSMQANKDICGKIDDRIRFQVFHVMQMIMSPPVVKTELDGLDTAGTLMPRKNNRRTGANIPIPMALLRATDLNIKLNLDADTDADSIVSPTFADVDDYDDDDDYDNEDDANGKGNGSGNRNNPTGIDGLPSITRGAWPWLAAIYVNNLTTLAYQCSGTLISARVVISSAHCFQMFNVRYTANEVLVFLGRHNLKNWNEEGSLAAPVDDIFIHPDYDRNLNSYDADIAVVVLKHTVRFNTFIRPACMWTGSTKAEYIEGEPGVVVGWGLSSKSNQSNGSSKGGTSSRTASAVPRIISAPIVSNDVCFKANENFRSLSSNRTFCAGIVLSSSESESNAKKDPSASISMATSKTTKTNGRKLLTTGPCTGDSGAGLMIYKNNRWVLRGTVSATLPSNSQLDADAATSTTLNPSNCNVNQYVIYTDVAKFLDWVFAFII